MNDYDTQYAQAAGVAEEPPPRPAFVKRLWMVFVQPGDLFGQLALNPAWYPMAAFVAIVAALSLWFLPAEAFEAVMQARIPPDQAAGMPQISPEVIRWTTVGGIAVVTFLFPLVLSLITYVIFVFIRGDEATFKQHLSVMSHAGVITAVGSLFMMPLRMRSLDIEQILSVGTFFPFLPDGFLLNMLTGIDLFALWGCVVAGLGVSVISRKSWGSTASILVALLVVVAIIRAFFIG